MWRRNSIVVITCLVRTNILPFLASSKINSKIELLLLCNGNISLRCCCWSQFQDEYMMFVMGHTSNRDTRSVMCTVVRKFILFSITCHFKNGSSPEAKLKLTTIEHWHLCLIRVQVCIEMNYTFIIGQRFKLLAFEGHYGSF